MTAPRHLRAVPDPLPDFSQTRFSTVAEVAKALRISKMGVYRLINQGTIPHYRFGPHVIRVPTKAVWDYISGSLIDPNNVSKSKAL